MKSVPLFSFGTYVPSAGREAYYEEGGRYDNVPQT
jgi:hypothetical protein